MRVKKGKPEKQLGQIILAVRMSAEMVPDLIWSSYFFGFGPCIKMPYNNFHVGTKILGDQIYWDSKTSEAQMSFSTRLLLSKFYSKKFDIVEPARIEGTCQINFEKNLPSY